MKITQTFSWSILIGYFLYWWIFILINAVCIIFVSRHLKDHSLHILLLFFWQFYEPRCSSQNILGVVGCPFKFWQHANDYNLTSFPAEQY